MPAGPLHYKSGRIDLFNGDETEAGSFTDPGAGNFRYDANGNTTHTPRHEALAYTHDNQVRYANLGGGGQVRDFRHADQRVVRLLRKNGVMALTVYLGPFEYHLREGHESYTKLVLHVRAMVDMRRPSACWPAPTRTASTCSSTTPIISIPATC